MNAVMHDEKKKVLVPIIESQSNQAFHKLDVLTLTLDKIDT